MTLMLRRIGYAVAAVAAAAGVLWLLDHNVFRRRGPAGPEPFVPEERPRIDLGQMPVSSALSNEQALAVDRVMPAVVSIQVERRVTEIVTSAVSPRGSHPEEHTTIQPSIGSGAIVSRRGHIVTNWHVIEGGEDHIFVTLSGESLARRATLIDKDDQIDIALIKVEPRAPGEEFPALRFGDSDKMKRGHLVLAMGSPFNLRGTVTWGIISHRERRVSDTLTAYLQTDCTINPGNSGGPLVNLEGDIIGIVTRKLQGPDSGAAAEGYGLAIPGNDVSEAVERLSSKGRPRTYLGLQVGDWPESHWQQGKPPEAVLVTGIWPRSPAEKAGLRLGDVIESVNGARVSSAAEYVRATRGHKVGDTLTFTVRRGSEALQVRAALEDFDRAVPPESQIRPATVRGVTLRVLNRGERNLLGLRESIGLAVTEVADDSPLKPWLTRGLYVLHIATPDRKQVTSVATPDEFRETLESVAATGGYFLAAVTGEPDRWIEFKALP